MNVVFRKNPGFLYDVCQIIMCKTAKHESWIDLYVAGRRSAVDVRELEHILDQFSPINRYLLLLGYRDRKKGSLIGSIFHEFMLSSTTPWDIENFVQYISQIDTLKQHIVNYYFDAPQNENILEQISQSTNLDLEIQNLLYNFFLFPERYTQVIVTEVQKVICSMQQYHTKNLAQLLDCQENFNYDLLMQDNSPFAKKRKWDHGMKICYVSFSLVGKYTGLRHRQGTEGWLILGHDYNRTYDETIDPNVDVAAFGNAFGDQLRVRIIEEIVKNGEMTLADLAKELGVVNTIVVYHLDILKRENLLLHRYQGRKVLYCLNQAQVSKGIQAIKTLCGGTDQ